MASSFVLPELGENIESGTVTKLLVSVGDAVAKDQPVLEIETDKAVLEVPSSEAGVIVEIRAQEGSDINVGDVVLVFGDGAAATKAAAPAAAKPETTKPKPKPKRAAPAEAKEAEPASAPKASPTPAPDA